MKSLSLALAVGLVAGLSTSEAQERRVVRLEADCSEINFMFGTDEVAHAEQHLTVPMAVGTLELNPGENGGIRIKRGSGTSYAITACIGAGGRTRADAQRAADAVRLVVEGARVRVQPTPDTRNWGVHLVVEAPRGAQIHAETRNGPIGVDGVEGRLTLRASNGPIGLDDVAGQVDARAINGPIGVTGSRGDLTIDTENGPISVTLSGNRWDGRLSARAENGPLSVRVPARYTSGVEISSSGHGPWSCRIAECRTGNRDWDDRSRSLKFGGDPVVVRISTVNGPVTIAGR